MAYNYPTYDITYKKTETKNQKLVFQYRLADLLSLLRAQIAL